MIQAFDYKEWSALPQFLRSYGIQKSLGSLLAEPRKPRSPENGGKNTGCELGPATKEVSHERLDMRVRGFFDAGDHDLVGEGVIGNFLQEQEKRRSPLAC